MDGKLGWDGIRELLFRVKRESDKWYRNMMYHFRFTPCDNCTYWDDVYTKHLAQCDTLPLPDLTDEEMLAAADAADQ